MAAEGLYGRGPARRQDRFHDKDVGDEALRFARWFVKNKFALMESFVHELDRDPLARNPEPLRRRFLEAVRHAEKVLLARAIVTFLLAGSAVTALASAVVERLQGTPVLGATVEQTFSLLDFVIGISGSLTLVLIVARLGLDRYLELIDVTATYTAMQLASAR